MGKLILVTNPGSASRKYALYEDEKCLATLHFEYVDNQVVCNLAKDGEKKLVNLKITDITESASECERLLREHAVLTAEQHIDVVAARLVAPSRDFCKDQLVDQVVIDKLEKIQSKAPLHTGVNLAEIKYFKQLNPDLPVVAVSDSSFHATKPIEAFRYALSIDLQDQLDIGRFGYHGISVSSIVEIMKRETILPSKLIVCHLGGGASVSAVKDGQSLDNSMGYSPLEGLMMATRAGNLDVSVALAFKKHLNLSDNQLEQYLNKQAGLLGMTSKSDDMRIVMEDEKKNDQQASEAMKTYLYRLRKVIGEMAAALNGVDAIVFTATVGERSSEVRQRLCQELTYLGFELDAVKNQQPDPVVAANLAASDSKPIYMIHTDESREMARRAMLVLG